MKADIYVPVGPAGLQQAWGGLGVGSGSCGGVAVWMILIRENLSDSAILVVTVVRFSSRARLLLYVGWMVVRFWKQFPAS